MDGCSDGIESKANTYIYVPRQDHDPEAGEDASVGQDERYPVQRPCSSEAT